VNLEGPVPLSTAHVVDDFVCGVEALDRWIAVRAKPNQVSGASRTWVVLEGNRVVAFYASATAAIVREAAPKSMRRNQPDVLPAVLLSRLAVSKEFQGRGLAAALLKHFIVKALEVSERVGVRVMLVHVKDEAISSFYEKYGFTPSPLDPLTLLHLLPASSTNSKMGMDE